jgi:hypothetical protein
MLNFLQWVARTHSDVRSLRSLSADELLRLASEYEQGRMGPDSDLERKWKASFDFLLDSDADWDGYASLRRAV